MEETQEKHIPIQIIVRRLYRRMRKMQDLYLEVEALESLLPVPTPEEFKEIVRGSQPLSLEVLLLGVMGHALFHLSEARNSIDRYKPLTLSSLGKGTHRFWYDELGELIERQVRWHANGPLPPLDHPPEQE